MLRLGRNVGIFERAKTTQQEVVEAITAGVPTKVSGIPQTAGATLVSATEADVVGQDPVAPAEPEPTGARRRSTGAASTTSSPGNLGVLPIALGIVFIVVFFSFKATNFFTANNFDNVIIQMAGTAMLAYGVVFVLLLGEIDLSISYVAGIGAITVAELQLPGSGHVVNGLLAMVIAVVVCALIGARSGLDRRVRGRPLVRRHARGLHDLAGRDPAGARATGLDHHPGPLDQLHRQLLLLERRRLAHRRDHHAASTPLPSSAA